MQCYQQGDDFFWNNKKHAMKLTLNQNKAKRQQKHITGTYFAGIIAQSNTLCCLYTLKHILRVFSGLNGKSTKHLNSNALWKGNWAAIMQNIPPFFLYCFIAKVAKTIGFLPSFKIKFVQFALNRMRDPQRSLLHPFLSPFSYFFT